MKSHIGNTGLNSMMMSRIMDWILGASPQLQGWCGEG
jgi:hypothetical protein